MKVVRPEDLIGKIAILVIQPEAYVEISSEIPIEIVNEWDMEGVLVSANKPYMIIKESLRKYGVLDKIVFVDCASRFAGDNPSGERMILVKNPANLTELSISITKSIKMLGERKFLVFDSLTTLLIYCNMNPLLQFVHSLGLRMKANGITCFLLAVEQEATKEMLRFLSTIADEFIHLGIDEVGEIVRV